MSKIIYRVVKHDGGWAYEKNGTHSEKFPTREGARKDAKLAASEQAIPGDTTAISFEDKGRRHNEIADGPERAPAGHREGRAQSASQWSA
jgi:uncharacterized protein DUF2188